MMEASDAMEQPQAILSDSERALRLYGARQFDRFDDLCTTDFWVAMAEMLREELVAALGGAADRKAEAAAKDFAEAIRQLLVFSRAGTFHEENAEREAVLLASDALARHPEYAPDRDFLPGETGERYPPKP